MKFTAKRFSQILFSLTALSLLAACSQAPTVTPTKKVATPHYVSRYNAANDPSFTSTERQALASLNRAGAYTLRQGERVWVILPIDRFFVNPSTNLKPSKRTAMTELASFINSYAGRYSHPRIRVSAYTNKVYAYRVRKQRSRQYVETVAAYLWNAGVPKSALQLRAMGAKHPIATNVNPQGGIINRRIVIQIN
ncbi:MAG: OmpA family protein [Gammaproteobacteria bacterium]|nr:OmpA family protein [Gammaproteobacteria bacterium]